MAIYDLYNTDTGALIRSQSFASPPPNPAGKPWAWKARPNLSPGDGQEIVWDETTSTMVVSDKQLEARRAEIIDAIKTKVFGRSGLIAAGFQYALPGSPADWHTYQIGETSQVNMTSVGGLFALDVADAHGGFWRDADNVNVDMTQAECIAFFAATAAYKSVIVRRMWQLIVAANAAADSAALDLINVSAGSIDGAGGWPANGS